MINIQVIRVQKYDQCGELISGADVKEGRNFAILMNIKENCILQQRSLKPFTKGILLKNVNCIEAVPVIFWCKKICWLSALKVIVSQIRVKIEYNKHVMLCLSFYLSLIQIQYLEVKPTLVKTARLTIYISIYHRYLSFSEGIPIFAKTTRLTIYINIYLS